MADAAEVDDRRRENPLSVNMTAGSFCWLVLDDSCENCSWNSVPVVLT